MPPLFQVIPLYLESDNEAREFFSTSNYTDLETITGSRLLLFPPKSMAGIFEEEGRARFPGLQSRDLPCLWAEDDTKAHFHVSIRKLQADLLRGLFCDLSDAAENAGNLADWEKAFRQRSEEYQRQSAKQERPEAEEGASVNHSSNDESHQTGEVPADPASSGGKSNQFDWTVQWGKIAGIGGLALATFVTILLKFKFPLLPAPYIPLLLVLLYGVAIFGCAIWMVERLNARQVQQNIASAVALPALFLTFALGFGILGYMTLPRASSAEPGSQADGAKHQSEKGASPDGSDAATAATNQPEIHGIVLDAGGRAAGRALVVVAGYGKDATFTDATGSFVLPSHTARLNYVTLHAERPPDGPANLDNFIVGSGLATLRLGSAATGDTGKHSTLIVRPKPTVKPVTQNPPDAQTAKGSSPGEADTSQNACDSFQQFMGSESALATLAEKAFSRKDYRCVLTYLEQAKRVASSGVWERDLPYLAAAYLLARNDRTSFQGALGEMLGEMRRPNTFLHHGPTIGMAIGNLSEVRSYLDSQAQKTIDDTINQAIQIRTNLPN